MQNNDYIYVQRQQPTIPNTQTTPITPRMPTTPRTPAAPRPPITPTTPTPGTPTTPMPGMPTTPAPGTPTTPMPGTPTTPAPGTPTTPMPGTPTTPAPGTPTTPMPGMPTTPMPGIPTTPNNATYPEIYYKILPFIILACDQLDSYNIAPDQDMLDRISDNILNDVREVFPEIDEYTKSLDMNERGAAVQTISGLPYFGNRRIRRRGILRDLIDILLMSELYRRRRRNY